MKWVHMLSLQRVVEIYFIKQQLLEDQDFKKSMRGMSKPVSKVYDGVLGLSETYGTRNPGHVLQNFVQCKVRRLRLKRQDAHQTRMFYSLTLLVFRILEKLAVPRELATANLALLG